MRYGPPMSQIEDFLREVDRLWPEIVSPCGLPILTAAARANGRATGSRG